MSRVFDKQLWTKQLRAWYLYDFANSLPNMAFGLYFAQWVTVDNGLTDFWFALPFVLSTAILIFLSPLVGAIGDRTGNHHRVFMWSSLAAVAAAILLWVSARFVTAHWAVVVALVCYGLFMFFEQLALVPYTAFIKYLAPQRTYGAVSGIGYACNELGSIATILISIPFAAGVFIVLGSSHVAPLMLPPLLFLLLSIPAFMLLRTPAHPRQTRTKGFFAPTIKSFKDAKNHPGVRPLLLSFYLFSDAIASITLFAAIYLEKALAVPDTTKAVLFLIVIVSWFLGSFLGGILADVWGRHKTLLFGLVSCALMILGMAVAYSSPAIFLSFLLFGASAGIVYASSRAYLASLIPQAESGKYFGLYTFSERFASVVGPLIWGIIIWCFRDIAPLNYRYAVVAMAVLALLGALPLFTIPRSARA